MFMPKKCFILLIISFILIGCCASCSYSPLTRDYALFADKVKVGSSRYKFVTNKSITDVQGITFNEDATYGDFKGYCDSEDLLLLSFDASLMTDIVQNVCISCIDYFSIFKRPAHPCCIEIVGNIDGTDYIIAQFIVSADADLFNTPLVDITVDDVKSRFSYIAYADFLSVEE